LLVDAIGLDIEASAVTSFAVDLPFFDAFLVFLPEPSLLYLAKYPHGFSVAHSTKLTNDTV